MIILGKRVFGYDWDKGNLLKCQKHGVSISEIEGLFKIPFLLQADINHSQEENRYLAIGLPPASHRPMFVAFTLREKDDKQYIRPISARYMHEKEVHYYEQITNS